MHNTMNPFNAYTYAFSEYPVQTACMCGQYQFKHLLIPGQGSGAGCRCIRNQGCLGKFWNMQLDRFKFEWHLVKKMLLIADCLPGLIVRLTTFTFLSLRFILSFIWDLSFVDIKMSHARLGFISMFCSCDPYETNMIILWFASAGESVFKLLVWLCDLIIFLLWSLCYGSRPFDVCKYSSGIFPSAIRHLFPLGSVQYFLYVPSSGFSKWCNFCFTFSFFYCDRSSRLMFDLFVKDPVVFC